MVCIYKCSKCTFVKSFNRHLYQMVPKLLLSDLTEKKLGILTKQISMLNVRNPFGRVYSAWNDKFRFSLFCCNCSILPYKSASSSLSYFFHVAVGWQRDETADLYGYKLIQSLNFEKLDTRDSKNNFQIINI